MLSREQAELKYPIVLVHGAGFEDNCNSGEIVGSWGTIPKFIRKQGVPIFFGRTKAWASIIENAEILKESILNFQKEYDIDKVNIIAHSMGGLESRYMITHLGMAKNVASLTTISAPHRGLKTIDALHNTKLYQKIIELLATRYFGSYEQFLNMSLRLKHSNCVLFNRETPNMEGVYYQSYGADMKSMVYDPLLSVSYKIISYYDGENDGLVPIRSARWGNYKGIFESRSLKGLSHRDLIDMHKEDTLEDIRHNYLQIILDLEEQGL
nr:alpha/beta fold hydrolase [uncultured Cellulosilyticum sp.]